MSIEEKFNAAVNVIKGLPPKGIKICLKYIIDKKTKEEMAID